MKILDQLYYLTDAVLHLTTISKTNHTLPHYLYYLVFWGVEEGVLVIHVDKKYFSAVYANSEIH